MTRTEKQADELLDRITSDWVPTIGFRPFDKCWFMREEHDAIAQLSFPRRLDPRGFITFTCNVGLRFEPLAKWLNDENDSPTVPTIMMPIHLLREDKTYTEWKFSIADELEKLRDPIVNDVKRHGLPFLERYSRLAEVRKTLESSDKKDWIGLGLNVDSRVTILAAIHLVEGDKARALKTLDDGMKALEESLADKSPELRKRERRKRGFDIEYLRKRVLANG
jgi:hypothetical protein